MTPFPFSAVVGQEQAKLALQLVAVDPGIGGVLLRGEKGSAKTTLARGLTELMDDAPFVELPLGATEDRLVGSIDVAAALAGGAVSFRSGLLADSHGGILYVDEVNLLADHLVDTLLDVAASGVNRVERDGIAHQHDARFVLVGSMNPEEGELRPQLLDRFGLCVEVRAPLDPVDRAEIVRRRLAFEKNDGTVGGSDRTLAARLQQTRPADVPDELLPQAAAVALAAGVEGLRADLVLCRAAAAHAALTGRAVAGTEDLRAVAPMAIAHRSRRSPFDPPVTDPERLQKSIDDALQTPHAYDPPPYAGGESDTAADSGDGLHDSSNHDSSNPPRPMHQGRMLSVPAPARAGQVEAQRGRTVRDLPLEQRPERPISVTATVRRAVADGLVGDGHRARDAPTVGEDDLRVAVRSRGKGSLVILTVDTSASMGAASRAEAATGSVLGLLADAYQRRDQVCMVTFGAGKAETILPPTGSTEVARRRLQSLQTGGATPLAAGLQQALAMATSAAAQRDTDREPLIVLLSDGRATAAAGDGDPFAEALEAAAAIGAAGVRSIVVDCECGSPRLGLAREVALAMGARFVVGSDLSPQRLDETIRREVAGDR